MSENKAPEIEFNKLQKSFGTMEVSFHLYVQLASSEKGAGI
jgi:hypothetical protein